MPPPSPTAHPPSPLLWALQPAQGLPARDRRLMVGAVALVHAAALWALLQVNAVQRAVLDVAPLMVNLLVQQDLPSANPPPRPLQAPVLKSVAPTPALVPALLPLPLPAFTPAPSPAPLSGFTPTATHPAAVSPLAAAAPLVNAPAPSVPQSPQVPAAAQTPTTAPVVKKIPSSALRYLSLPHLNFPLLSRRAQESGEVLIRIVVDANGRLKDAWVQKSSGFARIDQAALQDIRSARFAPYMEDGQALEVESVAVLAYDLDR